MAVLFGTIQLPSGAPAPGVLLSFRAAFASPLVGANAVVRSGAAQAVTNPGGFFSLSLNPGTYYLYIDGSVYPVQVTVPATPSLAYYFLQDVCGLTPSLNAASNCRPFGAALEVLDTTGAWYRPDVLVTAGSPILRTSQTAVNAQPAAAANAQMVQTGLGPAGQLQLLGTDGNWYVPYVTGPATAPAFTLATIAAAPSATAANHRFNSANGPAWQLYNVTSNCWHTWFTTNGALSLGPACS